MQRKPVCCCGCGWTAWNLEVSWASTVVEQITVIPQSGRQVSASVFWMTTTTNKKKNPTKKFHVFWKRIGLVVLCKIYKFMMLSLGTKKKENPARMDGQTEDLPQVGFQHSYFRQEAWSSFIYSVYDKEMKTSCTARGSRENSSLAFINVRPVQLEATQFWLSWPVWATLKHFNFLIST